MDMAIDFAYLDKCNNIMDAMLEDWEEVPLYNQIFEADDPESNAKTQNASEIGDQSIGLLQKMVAKIRAIFRAIKNAIANAFEYITAGKDERMKFDDFLEECKNDPNLRGKKITFHDYREIISKMDKECSDWEKEYRKFKESEAEDHPTLGKTAKAAVDKFGKDIKEIAEGEGISFAVEAAIEYAKQSKAHAWQVKKLLEMDEAFIGAIEKELGKREARKFKKKIKKLNSSLKILRFIAGGRDKEVQTIAAAVNEIKGNIWKMWRVHRRAKKGAHGDAIKRGEKAMMKYGLNIANTLKDGDGKELAETHVEMKKKKAGWLTRKANKLAAKAAPKDDEN